MATPMRWVVALSSLTKRDDGRAGGKAARLGQLSRGDFSIPSGFCLTVEAYDLFIKENNLDRIIRMELDRKSLSELRWEEIWDVALRIRSAFNTAHIPLSIEAEVRTALACCPHATQFAVRSSAPGEDSRQFSFAGLHESLIGMSGTKQILDAIRIVWASLWSDAAILYRKEIGLDPAKSQMAVLVQSMVVGDKSGVTFGRDPRQPRKPLAIIEAVPGLCQDLVDGTVDPDRWVLSRPSGKILEWNRGNRLDRVAPVLSVSEIKNIYRLLVRVEDACGWSPDIEWTQLKGKLTLLQARPITDFKENKNDKRSWYMSLKPGENRMRALRQRVTKELIPELEKTGKNLSNELLEGLSCRQLAAAIRTRKKILAHWRKIYWDEFIPFAHGVRRLAVFYNDIVKPSNPYEFVGLFSKETTLASRRIKEMRGLANDVLESKEICRAIQQSLSDSGIEPIVAWNKFTQLVEQKKNGALFLLKLRKFMHENLDLVFESESLQTRPDLILNMLSQMAELQTSGEKQLAQKLHHQPHSRVLEKRFFRCAGKNKKREAEEILSTARLSWRLRDDDNVLLGRIENQLLRALLEGAKRLRFEKRWPRGIQPVEAQSAGISKALSNSRFRLPFHKLSETKKRKIIVRKKGEKPRQLVGQPVGPGVATGRVCRVSGPRDMARFRAGDVLVCDSIQPSMTHLVPLASGIVERRGGMLMHGAIVARELGRPCVNGIPNAMEILMDGEQVTVDGYLGIVTVGEPEFDLEKGLGFIVQKKSARH